MPVAMKEGRRLATLFGSQLGQLGGGDETTAYYTEVMNARILHHHGAIMQSADDVFLAEFNDAANAVNCAIDAQERFAQHNKLHLDKSTIEVKIAIHFGEMFFREGKLGGSGVDITTELLSIVPTKRIYITREVFARVRMLLPLQLEDIGKKNIGSLTEPKELLSVSWQAVTGNLEASLKKLREDDLQRATSLSSKLGFGASTRAVPVIIFLLLIFLIFLTKILKWL